MLWKVLAVAAGGALGAVARMGQGHIGRPAAGRDEQRQISRRAAT
jgi:fluoride ion exporter CrcB/FEX